MVIADGQGGFAGILLSNTKVIEILERSKISKTIGYILTSKMIINRNYYHYCVLRYIFTCKILLRLCARL